MHDSQSRQVHGQPSDQISSSGGTSAAEAGAGIALGRLSGLLGETASQTIGLDVVDLEPRGLGGVTLVVGRYLTPRLYVAVRQPVAGQPGTEATGFERLPSLEAELASARWLLFNLQGDAQGFGLRLRSRWGY
jgi:translocation and assembly module TamB